MITLTIVFLLVFVPASRSIVSNLLRGILTVLGIAFLITRNSGGHRRGL
jgi:hypothetical protein